MSTEEKRKLGTGLGLLSPEDLNKALEIIAEKNPNFQATAEEVDLDMDAQSESTLWKLKFFVREALEGSSGKSSMSGRGNDNNNAKRKREICDALAKTTKKRSKKPSSYVYFIV
ncbi:PREDICTED: transcription factor GTE1-like isoform X2 [Nelumbo nucifera]|nr:PREDICTED: transcription factor GTE1-like isoform X2 [Nelumbo nucifera]